MEILNAMVMVMAFTAALFITAPFAIFPPLYALFAAAGSWHAAKSKGIEGGRMWRWRRHRDSLRDTH